jgi:hypothetical protein
MNTEKLQSSQSDAVGCNQRRACTSGDINGPNATTGIDLNGKNENTRVQRAVIGGVHGGVNTIVSRVLELLKKRSL